MVKEVFLVESDRNHSFEPFFFFLLKVNGLTSAMVVPLPNNSIGKQ